jgi:tape measure domain-containing protein
MAEIKNNLIELEVVYSKLNKQLDENITRLNLGAKAVENYNKTISTVPSEFQASLVEIKKKTDDVAKSKEKLRLEEIKLQQAREKAFDDYEKKLEREKKAQERASEQAKRKSEQTQRNAEREGQANLRLAQTNHNLNRAYNLLNENHKRASERLQDLIVRGRTATQTQSQYNRELREAQRDFQKLDQRIRHADQAVGRFNRNVGNYQSAFNGLRNLMGAFGIVGGLTLFASIVTDTIKLIKELESLNLALKQVSDTTDDYNRNVAFIKDISEDFGLAINDVTKQFTQFYVTAKDKVSAQEIENIFRSIAKAGATMGLSQQQQERAFLAVNQMMSKGTVQAEELRGQLGEALPGALGIMAKALGVTEKKLGDMMKAGELMANEVLPKFAQELEKAYGIENVNRVETLTAETNRLSNSWTDFIANIDSGQGVISNFVRTAIVGLTKVINLLSNANKGMADFEKESFKGGQEGTVSFLKESVENYISILRKRGVSEEQLNKERVSKTIEYAKKEIELQKRNLFEAEKNSLAYEDVYKRQTSSLKNILTFGRSDNKAKKQMEDNALAIQRYKGAIKGLENLINETLNPQDKQTKNIDLNTEATKKNTVAKKEAEIYAVGSVKWIQQQISKLKELNDTQSLTNEEYQVGLGAIKFYEQWLERLVGTTKELKEETEGISLDLGGSEFITDADGDELIEQGKQLRELIAQFRQTFVDDFADQSGFGQFLDILGGSLKQFEGDAVASALAISEAFQEAFNTIAQASMANFEAERQRLTEQRDFATQMAGDSATAREEIDRQYDERSRAIRRREAEAQKRLAIFNIAINTAQGIIAALAMTPPNVPLSIGIGAIGAVQAGLVASQQIPQFWKGTDYAPEGLAWTQEKGAEVITDSKGKIKTLGSDKGAQLTYLNKGDKVYKSHEDYINKVLSKNGIDNLGSYMNFAPKIEMTNSITKEDLKENFSNLAKIISNKEGVNISIDEKGFLKRKGNKEILNSRLTLKSRNV